ncbi:MAG: hypothetical protein ACO1NX_05350 [Chitinophagaceae bacterium]
MKIYVLFLLAFVTLAACNNAGEQNAHVHDAGTVDTAAMEGSATEEITLKKDGKWNADEATNKNVSALQASAAEWNKRPLQSTEDYQALSADLQQGLNTLVKECKMKGADHDALHLWLEPLLAETKELKSVASVDAGDRLWYSIRTRLADYNLYFN